MLGAQGSRWKTKPPVGAAEIDWTHPLSQNLAGLYLMNEGAGNLRDLASGVTAVATGGPTWTTAESGLGIQAATSKYFLAPDVTAYNPPTPFTILAAFKVTNSGNTQRIFSHLENGGAFRSYELAIDNGSTDNLSVWCGDLANGWANATTTVHDNIPHLGGAIISSTAVTFYRDGKTDGTVTRTPALTNVPAYIGVTSDGVSTPFTGTIYGIWLWSRTLPADQVQWHYAEPYAMLRPIVRHRYFAPTAAVVPPPATGVGLKQRLIGRNLGKGVLR